MPIKLELDADQDFNINREKDIIFALSSNPKLLHFCLFNENIKGP